LEIGLHDSQQNGSERLSEQVDVGDLVFCQCMWYISIRYCCIIRSGFPTSLWFL